MRGVMWAAGVAIALRSMQVAADADAESSWCSSFAPVYVRSS